MKKYLSFLFVLSFMYACSDIEGNLVGVSGRDTWYPDVLGPGKVPLGMVYVPSGAYQAGEDDEDIMGFHTARKRTVSVPAFYMDATEISNNEYRQFVHWVRDSIAREKLYRRSYDEEAERWVNIPDNFFKEPYRTLMAMGSDLQGGNTPFQLFMDSTNGAEVDKTIMTMLGSYDKSKGKGKKLVNGFQYDQKKYGITNGPDEKFDVVMSDDDLRGIFQMYSGAAKKNAPDKKSAKGASTKTKYNQGGRVENRKYFTLNWLEPVDYEDPEVAFMLSDMYLSEAERFYNRREIDTRLLYFDYYWIDYKEAARRGKIITKSIDARKTFAYDSLDKEAENRLYQRSRREPLGKDYKSNDLHRSTLMTMDQNTNKVWVDTTGYTEQWSEFSKLNDTNSLRGTILQNPGQDLDLGFTNSKGSHNAIRGHSDRSRFIIKERINIYPDTLCWVRDFTYANKSAMTQNYFWNTAYDNYPVVGVTWSQAKAFSVWRTQIFHSWLQSNGDLFVNDFRLPTESEWERGARGDLDNMQYPWGGPYIRNSSGCFLANFKPMRGRYFEDGGFYTVKVYSYNPNGFGLYCMAGNVAEWCSTAYDESTYEFAHDMAQDFEYDAKDGEAPVKKRKVLRGGSWKDIGYYLMNATRTYEYQDTAKSYIGFRNTMTHLGRGGKDIEQENGEEIQTDIILN
ncbi:MAG: SUMF1/EgtB/PvdO family nonheme iron enzyme [Crocinitomicaceae bacterium]|nr:SUMF1/EgtB/PvdO family nonheme iron enzyme [Crocinitomicaceae bacterium]MDP4723686.1 SUMF1/EgtB/PvdO family nonheme iron enzyme [Crocinitomicaceae bacterium]MDP4738527.1 SUMF1/EgtB/PvdO family nonheme iron enzyme [Crocinitomicaceae bacterium]MDP4798683.1 SUMF1/EgtB/PvdO family nonheme iron enzyme [Crocinitomicaceae bacterium]MDP4806355.1 SUMF1/EgtB/PvdO family nonheme iron enzyme [Crocinitomicaceae bacterium]